MINIDILLLLGTRSGFEFALDRTASYLAYHDCNVRFVQIIETNVKWYSDNVTFKSLGFGRSFIWDQCRAKYHDLLTEGPALPGIVITAGTPELVYVAKGALLDSDHAVPVVFWPHSEIQSYDSGNSDLWKILQYADVFYAISDNIALDISSHLPSKLIYRVNNTFDPEKIYYSDNRNTNKVAYIGRLSKEKNVDLIMRAIPLLKTDWEFSIIGDGDERAHLESLAAEIGCCEHITFMGWQNSPWKIVSDYRAIIISSNDAIEGAPLVCIEALACGIPVISTPLSFNKEVIQHGVNGYLFPFNDYYSLAQLLDNLSAIGFSEKTASLCRESVEAFFPEPALWDFLCKTISTAKLRKLPQMNWEDKKCRLVTTKLSILVFPHTSEDIFSDFMSQLFDQTLFPDHIEVIIVTDLNTRLEVIENISKYEQSYSDNIMVIQTDSVLSQEEALEIASKYATGVQLTPDDIVDITDSRALERQYFELL